jgi:UPF0716 family protein affecting phage T7 exclusion
MDINRVARGPALERVAVIVMAALIGRFWAAGLFVATSIAGALLLRRFGRGDANRIGFAHNRCEPCIRKRPRGNRARAILLIFPGFITFLPLGAAPAGRQSSQGRAVPGPPAQWSRYRA